MKQSLSAYTGPSGNKLHFKHAFSNEGLCQTMWTNTDMFFWLWPKRWFSQMFVVSDRQNKSYVRVLFKLVVNHKLFLTQHGVIVLLQWQWQQLLKIIVVLNIARTMLFRLYIYIYSVNFYVCNISHFVMIIFYRRTQVEIVAIYLVDVSCLYLNSLLRHY